MKRLYCPKCQSLIVAKEEKYLRLIEEQRNRNGKLMVGYYVVCERCKEKVLMFREEFRSDY